MLRDLSVSVSPLLALLLIVLTPVGTGQGVHRDQLLDPLFPHVHFADTSSSLLRNPQRVVEYGGRGPALGAGAGAASASLSMGLTPTVPGGLLAVPPTDSLWRSVPLTAGPRGALAEPPPDPPPTIG
jgi:hypothetical protein